MPWGRSPRTTKSTKLGSSSNTSNRGAHNDMDMPGMPNLSGLGLDEGDMNLDDIDVDDDELEAELAALSGIYIYIYIYTTSTI